MWHVGIHIWDVDPNKIEPDYDEYYAVCLIFSRDHQSLTNSGGNGI